MSSAGPSDERLRALLLEYLGRRKAGVQVDPAAFAAEHPGEAQRLAPLLKAIAGLPLDRAEAYVGEMLGAFDAGAAPLPGAGHTMQLPGVPRADELYDRRYRILSVLGEGGFGRVYKVEDTLNPGAQLALKEVLAEHQKTERFERRFRTEIQVQRNLSHPGIPQIFNDGKTAEGSFYYTMAFVQGTTLEEVLKQDAPLDPVRVVRFVRQILDVLEYAHGKGVVHRDLKPLNVVITDAGTEKERAHVLDFGIAKILDKESKIEHTLTMESAGPMGSPDYMSPEQVRGQEIDASTDLYALGVIIYRMVTGELPFSGKTLMEVLTARLDHEPPALDGKTVPPWLAQLVKGLLAREKTERPSTAEIQIQLAELAEGQKHIQRRQNVALASVAVVLLAGGVWFALSRGADPGSTDESSDENRGDEERNKGRADNGSDAPAPDPIDNVKPVITLIEPAGGAGTENEPRLLAEESVRLVFKVDDDSPLRVVKLGDETLTLGSDGHYVTQRSLGLAKEQFQLVAIDQAGNDSFFPAWFAAAGPKPDVRWNAAGVPNERREVELSATIQARYLAADGLRLVELEQDDARDDEALWNAGLEVGLDAAGKLTDSQSVRVGETHFALLAKDALGRTGKDVISVKCPPRIVALEVNRTQVADGGTVTLSAGTKTAEIMGSADAPLERVRIGGSEVAPNGDRFDHVLEIDREETTLELLVWHAGSKLQGAPVSFTLVREAPSAPSGCKPVDGSDVDEAGRALRVRHDATGAKLVLVPGADGALHSRPAFYLGQFELTRGQLGVGVDVDLPAADVNFDDASAFCKRHDLRLPTTDEWLWAARGPLQSAYPWGDAWEGGRANLKGGQDGAAGVAAVDAFARDESWCGAIGMGGNVSEWCVGSADAPVTYRGGNFRSPPPAGVDRSSLFLDETGPRAELLKSSTPLDYVGFRVALDAQD